MDTDQLQQSLVGSQAALPGPITLFREALRMYLSRFKIIFPVATIAFLASLLQTIVSRNSPVLAFFSALLSFIVTYLSYVAIIYIFAHENPTSTNYLTFYQKAWNIFIPYLIVSIISGIAVLSGLMIFIIPGIIVGVYLLFAAYSVALERVKGIQAITQSYLYVKNDWWKVFGRMVLFSCIMFIISLIVGLLTSSAGPDSFIGTLLGQLLSIFFIIPFGVAYFYILYKALQAKKAGPLIETDVSYVRRRLITIIIIGCILGILWLALVGSFM